MNSLNFLNNMLRTVIKPCLAPPPAILLQQTRNTYILKRRHPAPMVKKNSPPRRMKRRYFIYDLVENTDTTPKPPIKIVLTQSVEGVGDRGTILSMAPMKAYNRFLLPRLAVYYTPENLAKFDQNELIDGKKNQKFEDRTLDFLSTFLLKVYMSADNLWTLNKQHIRRAFREREIHLNDDCIALPEQPISGPDFSFENKEFYVTVTVNKAHQVNVRCRIYHWSQNENGSIPVFIDPYSQASEPIHPEFKEVLDSLPIHYNRQKAMNDNKTASSQ